MIDRSCTPLSFFAFPYFIAAPEGFLRAIIRSARTGINRFNRQKKVASPGTVT